MPRGRPRKHKKREKSGRGSRVEAERENREFAKWQRRHLLTGDNALKDDQLLDQKAATPLGVLFIGAFITEAEFHAGETYGEAVRFYRVTSGMPLDLPSRLGVRGADNREFPVEISAAARRKYMSLRAKLIRAGRGVLACTTMMVVDERVPTNLTLAVKGLAALAK